MPPPAVIDSIPPEQVVTDIVVATLLRVQRTASPDVSAAAARYLEALI